MFKNSGRRDFDREPRKSIKDERALPFQPTSRRQFAPKLAKQRCVEKTTALANSGEKLAGRFESMTSGIGEHPKAKRSIPSIGNGN